MKAWQLLVLLGVLGIVVYAASRPPQPTYVSAGGTNSLFSLFGSLAGGVIGGLGKSQAPGATTPVVVPNEGTYRTDTTSTITGNELIDSKTGRPLVYGTD